MKAKAYIVHQAMCEPELEWSKPKDCLSAEPLYSNRKPLTVVEIMREWNSANNSVVDFARAIEAKLKEKNI